MVTIEKFKKNLKEINNLVFTIFEYNPKEEEIVKEVLAYGNGLYILKNEKKYYYIVLFNNHYGEFSNKKNAIKILKYWKELYER